MPWYFIFENEDGEPFAVQDTNYTSAFLTLCKNFPNDTFELVNDFSADDFGDDRIDAMGLDVF